LGLCGGLQATEGFLGRGSVPRGTFDKSQKCSTWNTLLGLYCMYGCIWARSGSGLCFLELGWEGWTFVPTFTKNVKVGQPPIFRPGIWEA
jgi:hypothetical protein